MSLLARFLCYGLLALAVGSLARATSLVEEPSKTIANTFNRIVIKPGASSVFKPNCLVDPASFDVTIASVVVGEKVAFELAFNNISALPVKILGAEAGCSPQGCIKTLGKYPRLVPSGAMGKIEFLYVASSRKLVAATTPQRVELDVEF